ncbi:MAG TPA: phosphopantetheine-binding protein [Polyangiaceae bacterium]|nr:phosphopantetheine-binding protein [Polyangiaceae bacterium]
MTVQLEQESCSRRESFVDAVIRSLRKANRSIETWSIDESSSIVDDLGFDSLKMIDLVFALEEEIGISEFPLQLWYDREVGRVNGARFTVDSLVAQVISCVLPTNSGAAE